MPIETGNLADFADHQFNLVIITTSVTFMAGRCSYQVGFFATSAVAYDRSFSMLVGQAVESFLLWHGVLPDILPVMSELRADWQQPVLYLPSYLLLMKIPA